MGIIAAQSIGEPGTQLTMRTIHSGGVAGADDITQGLPTVARMFDVVGNVNEKILGREADLAPVSGTLLVTPEQTEYLIRIVDTDDRSASSRSGASPRPRASCRASRTACEVRAGDQITRGFVNFRKLRKLTDIESTMHTFVASVKDVYTSQGVDLNDKHIEVIARQMLRRVQMTNPGDSKYLLGQYVDRYVFADEVARVARLGGTPPRQSPSSSARSRSPLHRLLALQRIVHPYRRRPHRVLHRGQGGPPARPQVQRHRWQEDPAGTGLKPYRGAYELTADGYVKIDGPTSPQAQSLPEWAPTSSRTSTRSSRSSSTGSATTTSTAATAP